MAGWSRLDPAQRDRFFEAFLRRRCGSTGLRFGIGSGGGSETAARRSGRSGPLHFADADIAIFMRAAVQAAASGRDKADGD